MDPQPSQRVDLQPSQRQLQPKEGAWEERVLLEGRPLFSPSSLGRPQRPTVGPGGGLDPDPGGLRGQGRTHGQAQWQGAHGPGPRLQDEGAGWRAVRRRVNRQQEPPTPPQQQQQQSLAGGPPPPARPARLAWLDLPPPQQLGPPFVTLNSLMQEAMRRKGGSSGRGGSSISSDGSSSSSGSGRVGTRWGSSMSEAAPGPGYRARSAAAVGAAGAAGAAEADPVPVLLSRPVRPYSAAEPAVQRPGIHRGGGADSAGGPDDPGRQQQQLRVLPTTSEVAASEGPSYVVSEALSCAPSSVTPGRLELQPLTHHAAAGLEQLRPPAAMPASLSHTRGRPAPLSHGTQLVHDALYRLRVGGSGSTPGSMPVSMPRSNPGSVPGSMPVSLPESVPGSIPAGSVPGSTLGSIPGSIPAGSVPGSVPGSGFWVPKPTAKGLAADAPHPGATSDYTGSSGGSSGSSSDSRNHCRGFTHAIRYAPSLAHLASLLEQHGWRMNGINVAAAAMKAMSLGAHAHGSSGGSSNSSLSALTRPARSSSSAGAPEGGVPASEQPGGAVPEQPGGVVPEQRAVMLRLMDMLDEPTPRSEYGSRVRYWSGAGPESWPVRSAVLEPRTTANILYALARSGTWVAHRYVQLGRRIVETAGSCNSQVGVMAVAVCRNRGLMQLTRWCDGCSSMQKPRACATHRWV